MTTRNFASTVAIIIIVALVPLLGACHTTAGAGEDISQTGQAIKHSAQENTP